MDEASTRHIGESSRGERAAFAAARLHGTYWSGVGKDALYEEAMKEVLPEQYEKAVEEAKIEPVSEPEFDDVDFKARRTSQAQSRRLRAS